MTFSTKLKEEICNASINRIEILSELSAVLRYDANVSFDKISLTFENGSVVRRIFKDFKTLFNISPHIVIRNQKRLRVKQIYILEIKENVLNILQTLNLVKNNQFVKIDKTFLSTQSEMASLDRKSVV